MNYIHPLEKSAIQGVATGIATCVYYGMNAKARIFGSNTKLCYIGAIAGAVSSLLNDAVHSYVKNEVPIRKKAEDQASVGLGVAVGALMYNYVLFLANPNLARDTGIVANSLIGGGSEYAGSFLYNLFLAD